jgi:hypothetical protein
MLFLALVLAALAQTTTTFTAQAGAISCFDNANPYIQYYSYLVENSTPSTTNYVRILNTNTGQPITLPDLPNHPYGVDHGCLMNGFASPDNEVGSLNVWQFRISPSGEVVELNPSSIHWTQPAAYPAVGQPATFMMDANITTICTAECHPATGTFHLEGPFAFQWIAAFCRSLPTSTGEPPSGLRRFCRCIPSGRSA